MAGRAKIKGLAVALPVFGVILVVPPLTQIFATKSVIFNIPLIVIYMFCVWIGLIIASFLISRSISDQEDTPANASASRPESASRDSGDA